MAVLRHVPGLPVANQARSVSVWAKLTPGVDAWSSLVSISGPDCSCSEFRIGTPLGHAYGFDFGGSCNQFSNDVPGIFVVFSLCIVGWQMAGE